MKYQTLLVAWHYVMQLDETFFILALGGSTVIAPVDFLYSSSSALLANLKLLCQNVASNILISLACTV